MKRIFILMTLLMLGSEVAAECSYTGDIQRQGITLNNIKIPTDPSIPVGSILYTRKIGTGPYKNFKCDKSTNDQYIIDIGASEVAGVCAPRESDINLLLSIRFSVTCECGVEILHEVVR